jgi:hypothetical protein
MAVAADAAEYAVVVAADRDSLSEIIDSRPSGRVVLAIPPDLSASSDGDRCGVKVMRPCHLEGSHLDDTISSTDHRSISWKEYLISKQESREVVDYYEEAWNELGGVFEKQLRESGIRDSTVPEHVRSKLDDQTERFLISRQGFNKRLSLACRSFVTQRLIDRVVKTISSPKHGWYKFLHISDGEQGRTYPDLFGNYLADARSIRIRDPYVRHDYQVHNLEDLLDIVREPRGCSVELVTTFDRKGKWPPAGEAIVRARLDALRIRLVPRGFRFSYRFDPDFHDREIDTENWGISLGRGLDMYHPPESTWAPRRAMSCNIIYMTKPETGVRTPAMPRPVGQAQRGEQRPNVRAVPGLPDPRG